MKCSQVPYSLTCTYIYFVVENWGEVVNWAVNWPQARRSGQRVVAFEDNYFTLLPGDSRIVRYVNVFFLINTISSLACHATRVLLGSVL